MAGGKLTRILTKALLGAATRRVSERRQGLVASWLLLTAGVAFTVVWVAFFTGPLEFEARRIAIRDVNSIRGGPTIRIRTPDGVTYRVVEDLYHGSKSQDWTRDDVMATIEAMDSATVWLVPGRLRVQGIEGDGLRLDPAIGYRLEERQRRFAPLLSGLLLFLGGAGLWSARSAVDKSNLLAENDP